LKWDQIDFQEKVITLEADDTKTQEKREIPLDDVLVRVLKGIPRTLGTPNVFTYRGKRLGEIKEGFWTACRRAGIRDFRFHDLRHCAVTNLRKAGVGENTIMSISGHKTHDVFRRYDRIDRDDRQEALGKARRLIDNSLTRSLEHERKEG
jgi:integrase